MNLTPDQEACIRRGDELCHWQTRAIEAERALKIARFEREQVANALILREDQLKIALNARDRALTEYAEVATLHAQTLKERDQARAERDEARARFRTLRRWWVTQEFVTWDGEKPTKENEERLVHPDWLEGEGFFKDTTR